MRGRCLVWFMHGGEFFYVANHVMVLGVGLSCPFAAGLSAVCVFFEFVVRHVGGDGVYSKPKARWKFFFVNYRRLAGGGCPVGHR